MKWDLGDGLGPEDLFFLVAFLTAVLGLAGLVWKVRAAWKRTEQKLEDFLGDWYGTAERPGVAAKPGVLQRLSGIESEVTPNGGGSLKDSATRTEAAVAATADLLTQHIAEAVRRDERITAIELDLHSLPCDHCGHPPRHPHRISG